MKKRLRKKKHLSEFKELGKISDQPEERVGRITRWLGTNSNVEKYAIRKLTNVWYGPFDEFDSIG